MNQVELNQQDIVKNFQQIKGWEDRYKKIIQIGKELPKEGQDLYDEKFLVKGCQSQVWLAAHLGDDGTMVLRADSDAMIVKGLVALLKQVYSGSRPSEILATPPHFIEELGFKDYLSPSRANGFLAMVKQIMLYAQVFSMTQK